jgi:hypothetical protein
VELYSTEPGIYIYIEIDIYILVNLESSLSSWTGIDNYTQLWNIFMERNWTVSTEPVK